MQIYRAEDGETFQVNKTFKDIETRGSLELFLNEITGVEVSAVLAYLSDGRRLRDENVRELGGLADQSIFVFNKHYLDYELENILTKLRLEPPLQPEAESKGVRYLENVAIINNTHHDSILHISNTINVQHEALRIASTSLDLNVLSISDVFESFSGGARRELEKQTQLLEGLEFDLEVIGKIRIHPELLSPAVRKAVEAGEKARMLGDYVSNVRMRQVGEACAKTHKELRGRFEAAEESMNRLSSGASEIRTSIVNSGLMKEAQSCLARSRELLDKITEITSKLHEPRTDETELLAEMWNHDTALRGEVQLIADVKNTSTVFCLKCLRQISHLNNDLVFLPPTLSTLQADFRAKTNFAHIQRLHNMLYAYGATLVEIVRRKEFAKFFSQRAQTIAEIMAKLSAGERKRRQIYRGEVHGQLPFDTKGMEDAIPAIEINSTGVTNNIPVYSIERSDLISLLDELEKIEQPYLKIDDESNASRHNPLRETRAALEKLLNRMDTLEMTFDRMTAKIILSSSRTLIPRRQQTEHSDTEFQEIAEQLRELQDAKSEQERFFEDERQGLHAEIERLRNALHEATEQISHEQGRTDQLEVELRRLRIQEENNEAARQDLTNQLLVVLNENEAQRKALEEAQTEVAEQIKVSDTLHQELAQVNSRLEEVTRLEAEHMAQANTEREEAIQALKDAKDETEQRLRAQAAEADRVLRDIIAEADGDRAVLEHQSSELRGRLGVAERELKEGRSENEVLNADVAGLKEELQHELDNSRNVENTFRRELSATQDALRLSQSRLEESENLAKALLQVGVAFHESHLKALVASQPSSSKSLASLTESTSLSKSLIEMPCIDTNDLHGSLRILQEFDLKLFNETIAKSGSTIRKWQKQCKEYRDRAKGKISFRNFAKGDLALFLPTRNSISKPWAAFNVSFPHYFLQANNNLAEQLKIREWVVARITSIVERVADSRDPSSNPYGLADGTKFYMLQVEDWTQSSPSNKRKASPPKPSATDAAAKPPSPTEDGPPEMAMDSSVALTESPRIETPIPATRLHLGPRQRTYSAPITQPSSLSKLLAQAPPGVEESRDPTPPSPPRLSISRPSSPLAGPSRVNTSSSPGNGSPTRSQPTSPLARAPLQPSSSPQTRAFQPRPSSPLVGTSHTQLSSPPPPNSFAPPVSPSSSGPHPPSPRIAPFAGPSPSQMSVESSNSPHPGSRRSSSSSRPSSVLSARHHLNKPQKAAATTALSSVASGDPSGVSPTLSSEIITPSDSDTTLRNSDMFHSEGIARASQVRRRTTSASAHISSPLSLPTNTASGSALSSLANSWGATFGRRKGAKQSSQALSNTSVGSSSSTVTHRGASELLKRYDDILPHER